MKQVKEHIKVTFIGDSGVGKTSLIIRKIKGSFDYGVLPTIGSSHLTATEIINDNEIELCLWDTAGQEKYRSLVPLYTRDANVVVIVASIADHLSLKNIDMWNETVTDYNIKCTIFVVVNKIDLKGDFPTIDELRSDLTSKYQNVFFVSAREGEGVIELFYSIAKIGFEQLLEQKEEKMDQVVSVSQQTKKSSGSCC